MNNKENMKIVLVGHIDHGKSTLIGRLFYDTDSLPREKLRDIKQEAEMKAEAIEFAFVMDHLKEEREQGITIDTAQTFFSTDKRNYTIIDAPGHKEFIKNMITGASQAETAILLVDVDEGVRDQTKRHAYILSLLGIDQVIVAMNKMDLVDYEKEKFLEVKNNLTKFLNEINIDPAYIIPTSAKRGDNVAEKSEEMDWYKGITILDALDQFKTIPKPTNLSLRFPIQDVYEKDREKIITGRVESGRVNTNQEVMLLPENFTNKINKIKKFEGDVDKASAGESIGLVLNNMGGVNRGAVISELNNLPKIKERLNANLFWLSPDKIEVGETVVFKCTTQEIPCRISKIKKRIDSSTLEVLEENASILKEHEIGEVEISLDRPVVVDEFNKIREMGRFVLERDGVTNGGGIIVYR